MMKDSTNSGVNTNSTSTSSASASTPNTSIHCTVCNCVNHCQSQDYCGLNAVQIGTHESNPTEKQCVDCDSFKLK
jgi:hypothetical protein